MEGIVSSLVVSLISSSISLIPKLQTIMSRGVSEVQHWQSILEYLLLFLQDAEDKKQDSSLVASWLEEAEDLCYDLEDILEEFHYEALRQEIEYPGPGSVWSKMRSFPRGLRINIHMTRKLGGMTQRLQNLKGKLETLNLLRSSVPISSTTERSSRRDPSASVPSESIVVGRDKEKETIMQMLLTQNEGDDKIMVIPIVGMGGLGKTTLARYIYNDSRVESSFDVRGWACVSSDYDTKRISKEILQSVCKNCGEVADKTLDWIQCKLREELRNKKFLLVLDDNWNEKYADWEALRPPFLEGSCGSRIIVTTRSHHVADTVRTVDPIIPSHLSDDDCWSLLCSHAALDEKTDSFMRLQEIGTKIAQKCSGLPLAAMTIGGLLRYKSRVEQWEAILDNKSWMSKGGYLDIMSVLRMSYDDLDSQLKRCFSFLAIFPEDYPLEKEDVVLLWVGAGLIQLEEEGDSKIKMGHEVFDGLVSRSLLLLQRDNYFIMHDLVRDLAKRISGKNCLTDEWCKSARHVSYHICKNKDMVDRILKEKRKAILPLRSIVGLSQREYYFPNDLLARLKFIRIFQMIGLPGTSESESRLPKSIGKLALLRYLQFMTGMCGLPTSFTSLYNLEILRLQYSSLEQLPERIGNLANLCYLDLSYTKIQTLPSSFTSLRRLETLLLKCCSSFQQLPEGIGNLVNLCHLDLTATKIQTLPSSLTSLNKLETLILEYCGVLKQLPEGIEELRTLRSLSNFIIGEKLPLSSLHKMKNLRGSLEISNLLDAASPEDARLAQLSEIKLERLSLIWSTFSLISVSGSLDIAEDILQQLQPNEDLKELVIRIYVGSKLPTWLAGSLGYLAVLELESCYSCTSRLEAMASLEELRIIDCPEMTVFMGRMPRLKHLRIKNCQEVACTETLSLDSLKSLDVRDLDLERMSSFKEKVIQGSRHAKVLDFQPDSMSHWNASYTLPSIDLIGEDYCGEMKVQTLRVGRQDHLDRLPQWVSNAASLQEIRVESCAALKILLPNGKFPSSLTELTISNCNELESFHEEKLPATIEWLRIWNCSALEKKIEDRDQQLCSKISHIPFIEVNWVEISLL